jgi:hypothetical protein
VKPSALHLTLARCKGTFTVSVTWLGAVQPEPQRARHRHDVPAVPGLADPPPCPLLPPQAATAIATNNPPHRSSGGGQFLLLFFRT